MEFKSKSVIQFEEKLHNFISTLTSLETPSEDELGRGHCLRSQIKWPAPCGQSQCPAVITPILATTQAHLSSKGI